MRVKPFYVHEKSHLLVRANLASGSVIKDRSLLSAGGEREWCKNTRQRALPVTEYARLIIAMHPVNINNSRQMVNTLEKNQYLGATIDITISVEESFNNRVSGLFLLIY